MNKPRSRHLGRTLPLVLGLLGPTLWMSSSRAADLLASPFADAEPDARGGNYQKIIREGVAEYGAGHFEEALSLFRRAHEMSPSARTLRGIGMASFELRDYVTAVRSLSSALQDQRKPLSADQRKNAQDLLERSQVFVDVCTLNLVPRTARLLVDGRAPEFEPDGTLLLGLGAHAIEASAEGMAKLTRSIEVRGGSRQELQLSLEPTPRAARTRLASKATVSTASPQPEAASARSAAWLWASGGAALVAAGAGIYWYQQGTELDACRKPTTGLRCTTEDALSAQRNAGMVLTLAAGATAVALALVGILGSKPKPAQRLGGLDCSASPFGITCGGSF